MKSEAVNLLRFFQISKKCIIPIYQRTYSWTEEECDLLWNDIIRVGSSEKISNHFVGSFVYVQDSLVQIASAAPEYMVMRFVMGSLYTVLTCPNSHMSGI